MTDSEMELAIIDECARDFDPKDLGEWCAAFARMVREARAMVPRQVVVFEDRDCGFACYVDRAD
jgi:hypothetical protein